MINMVMILLLFSVKLGIVILVEFITLYLYCRVFVYAALILKLYLVKELFILSSLTCRCFVIEVVKITISSTKQSTGISTSSMFTPILSCFNQILMLFYVLVR